MTNEKILGKIIMVAGFPHAGTTKVRSLIATHPDVFEFEKETTLPTPMSSDEWVVAKSPRYSDIVGHIPRYHKFIFIMRNPYYVFSSLFRRFPDHNFPYGCGIMNYIDTLTSFLIYRNENPQPDKVFTIKYEELMDEKKIEEMFNWIGLDTPKYAKHHKRIPLSGEPYDGVNHNHIKLRNWQIEQPLMNMNTPDKLTLPEQIREVIGRYDIIQEAGYEKI